MKFLIALLICCVISTDTVSQGLRDCQNIGIGVQVLGSGGPEYNGLRASSSYLLWLGGRARVLIDAGAGSMLHYGQSGAQFEDLEAILLTHLHVDHTADLPALLKAAYFTERTRDLPVYGPSGNSLMPNTTAFASSLFSSHGGAYRYLAGYLNDEEAFRLIPHTLNVQNKSVQHVLKKDGLSISAIAVHHGPVPALAYRIDMANQSVTFSGDMNGEYHTLPTLAAHTDLLVAHHAIPENTTGAARQLHMPPSVIGEIAMTAMVNKLVLSHRMLRTIGHEAETMREIRKHFQGEILFAEDGMCIPLAMQRP